MYNYLLRLSFIGTNYHGWQIQPDRPTVQGVLKTSLEKILNSPVKLIGCCRTDSGVHALDYVANCISDRYLEEDKLLRGLNGLLPTDIGVREIFPVEEDFNARFGVKRKTYLYRIWNSPVRDPFLYPFSWQVPVNLNRELLGEALNRLKGLHDFTGFAKLEGEKETRIELDTEVRFRGELIELRFEASHFLRYMVRRIVGTAVWVAEGKLKLADMDRFLKGDKAPFTAPAKGLCLERVVI